jgi:hypothetical protein
MTPRKSRKHQGVCALALVAISLGGAPAWAAPGDYRQQCTPDSDGQQVCQWEVCESVPGLAFATRPKGKSGITPIGEEEGTVCRWVSSDPPPNEEKFCCEGRSPTSGVYTNCSKLLNYQKAKEQGNLCGQGRNSGKTVEVQCDTYAWNTQTGNLHDCR